MFLNALIGICIIGAATLPLINGAQSANICSGLGEGTKVRNVEDCGSYFQCINGSPCLLKCPTGELFNNYTRQCDSNSENVVCFSCPKEPTFLDIPVPNECNQFIRCFKEKAVQKTCEEGLRFDPTTRTCNYKNLVDCPLDIFCQPKNPELLFVRNPYQCSLYYTCIDGELTERQCLRDTIQDLHFNYKTETCDFPWRADCTPIDPNTSNIETLWYKPARQD